MAKSRSNMGIYILIISVIVIVAGLFRYSGIEHQLYHIDSSLIDGVFVWSVDKFLIIGIVPMIIIVFNHFLKKYEYSSYITFRYKSRFLIWFYQEMRLLLVCMGTILLLMLFCGILAFIMNGGKVSISMQELLLFPNASYLGKALVSHELNLNLELNYATLLLQCFLINTLEMFLIVFISNALEWISGSIVFSLLVSFGFCILVGVNPQAGYAYRFDFLNIKIFPSDFYYELINLSLYFKRILSLLAIVLFVNLIAVPFVRKRDFIK